VTLLQRCLETLDEADLGKKLTKKQIAAGKPPAGWTWKGFIAAGGSFGKQKPKSHPSKSKPPKKSQLRWMSKSYTAKKKAEKPRRHGKLILPPVPGGVFFDEPEFTEPSSAVKGELADWAARRKWLTSWTWFKNLQKGLHRGKLPQTANYLKDAKKNLLHLKDLGFNFWKGFGAGPHPADKFDQMSLWGSSSVKKQKEKGYTPEEKKLYKLRKTVHTLKRPAAGGLVVRDFKARSVEDMHVLIAETHPKYGKAWRVPKGGVDEGESLQRAAVREVREETGVRAKVANSKFFKTKDKFGGSADSYGLFIVLDVMKQKNPDDVEFIDAHKKQIGKFFFSWENNIHYFVMEYVSGRPINRPDPHEEMGRAEWMTLRVARKQGHKVKTAIDGLMPILKRMWIPEVEGAA
jgi:ADP-ribose pyrophosphatase YjhB (NUDIX family)